MTTPNSSAIVADNPPKHKKILVCTQRLGQGPTVKTLYDHDIKSALVAIANTLADDTIAFSVQMDVEPHPIGVNALCPVCGKPHNQEMLAVCDACQDKLNDCPECQSDDISFDWHVDKNNPHVIEWRCECNNCTFAFSGDQHSAGEVFHSWQIEPREAVSNG